MKKHFQDCQTERTVLQKTCSFNMLTGEKGPIKELGWETRKCGTPLFTDEEHETGKCRSCQIGWEHPENYTTAKGAPDAVTQNEPYYVAPASLPEPVAPEFIPVPFTPSEALYKRNSQMRCTDELTERCHFCNRPIRPTGLQVHMTIWLDLTTAEECDDSQGYFEVGPECAKKIPARFIFKNLIGRDL